MVAGFRFHVTLSCKADNFCFAAEFGFDGGTFFCECCSNPSESFRLGLYILSVPESNTEGALHTSILPLLVTALRITFGLMPSTCSRVDFNVPSSLSLPPDMCSWFAAQDILSRRLCIASDVISLPKYPFIPSTFRVVGGDFELGLTIELPLPLLELFLLLPFWCRSLAKDIREFTAGDCPTQPVPGLGCGPPKGPLILLTCGVESIESSISSASMRTSSSELLLEDSDIIIFTLPKELETVIRSAFPMVDHKELELMLLESRPPEKCKPFFLFGMFIARPVMVGEESGDDSASVELWRCVADRENSKPRDLLGRTLVGDPYVCE